MYYIALGLLIIFIVIIYYCFIDKFRRHRAAVSIKASAGVFDKQAQLSLQHLEQITRPNTLDRFHRGYLLRYNLLQDNLVNGGEDTHITQNQRADILQNVVQDYTAAAIDIANNPAILGGEFMMHQINDLGYIINNIDMQLDQFVLNDFNAIVNESPAITQNIARNRITNALTDSSSKSEAVNKALDDALQYTDDHQNVHDSKINGDLRITLNKLKASSAFGVNAAECIKEARVYINGPYSADKNNRNKATNALTTLAQIAKGEHISTYGETEDSIFAYVWLRCSDPRNARKSNLMRAAVVDSLADSIENGILVCINGRCARLLGSLVTLDYDEQVGSAMTFEAYKNQIYQETKDIVNNAVTAAKKSHDPSENLAANMFETGDEDTSTHYLRFKDNLRALINENISKYDYKLSHTELDNIRQECYIYATID